MKNPFLELKEKSETEVRKLLAEDREKLRDLRFRVSQGAHKGVRDIRKAKVRIARALTILGGVKK